MTSNSNSKLNIANIGNNQETVPTKTNAHSPMVIMSSDIKLTCLLTTKPKNAKISLKTEYVFMEKDVNSYIFKERTFKFKKKI